MKELKPTIHRYEHGVLGLPEGGKFVPFTNSEMGSATCLRRWWFSHVEGLGRSMDGSAVDRGAAWDTLTTDMYAWWEATDSPYPEHALDTCVWCGGDGCERCDGSGLGSLERAMAPWWDALGDDPPPFGEDDVRREEERLRLAFRGYVERYEARPMQHFRIVGVQSKLARVILNPSTGKPYRPTTLLVRAPGGWIRAGTAAAAIAESMGHEVKQVFWPAYQVGALDAVARDRSNGQGWVVDAKYTGNMGSYRERLEVDPQLPGYSWLLGAHLEHFGLTGVSGMMYDLAHSRLHSRPTRLKWKPPLVREMRAMAEARGLDPKGLRGAELQAILGLVEGHGGFSTSESKLAGVPSWILREEVERAHAAYPSDVDPDDYDEAIAYCEREVDGSLYGRPWRSFSAEDLERYSYEVFGKASWIAALHRAAVRVKSTGDLDVAYPRTPVCTMPGGRCSFRGPCQVDSPDGREAFTQRVLVMWGDEDAAVDNQLNLHDELGF